jgi:hypothetical protein
VGLVYVHMILTARRGDRSMRNMAASLFPSLTGAAQGPGDVVTNVDDTTQANLRRVSG